VKLKVVPPAVVDVTGLKIVRVLVVVEVIYWHVSPEFMFETAVHGGLLVAIMYYVVEKDEVESVQVGSVRII